MEPTPQGYRLPPKGDAAHETRTWAQGRKCQTCGCRLSRYNGLKFCSRHAPFMSQIGRERRKKAQLNGD